MKKLSIILIIIGVLLLIGGIVTPLISLLLMPPNRPSISIIGGADGPTATFLTSSLWLNSIFGILTIIGATILIIGIVLLIVNKLKK